MGNNLLTPNDIHTGDRYAATGETFDLPLSSALSAVGAASGNQTAYTVAAENDLHNLSIGMDIVIAGCTDAANNDGTFKITKLDYENLKVYTNNVKGTAEVPVGATLTITKKARAIHVATPEGGGIAADIEGNVAHDAVDAGKPVKIGGKASTSRPTAVANGDRVNAYFDVYGRQHVYDEGGGGVSGGGFSTYTFTPTNSLGLGTTAYNAATKITVSGHSFSPESVALVKIDRFASTGAFLETLTPSQNTITAATLAGVTTYTISGAAFGATDLFVVYQGGPERTVTLATDSQRTEEISPLPQQVVEDSLVDTTNVGAGPAYYPSTDGMQMLGYADLSLTGKLIEADAEDNTFTVEATNDEDATAANRDWIALYGYRSDTDAFVNSIVCNAATVTFAWDFDNINYKYVRLKFIGGASATNTVIAKARRKAV